jgi:carboxylesterase type B
MSEDCLTLTVWNPRQAPSTLDGGTPQLLPTIVFFHGGDLMFGASSFYNFSSLVETGEAIVVAVNYRLSLWGWLAAAELRSADPRGVSGNYGLLDMQEALRWVGRNAPAFGGDPSRVTVLGQSSGGTAVLALLASPASRGLFSRAISLSGSHNVTMGLDRAEVAGAEVVQQLGCAPTDGRFDKGLACLLAKNTSELAAAVPPRWVNMDSFALPGPAQRTGYREHGVLIVDGVTVSAALEEAFAGREGGVINDVPLMIGTCAQEVEMCPRYDFSSGVGGDNGSFAAVSERTIGAAFGGRVLSGARRTYEVQIEASPQLAYASMVSDMRFTCGNLALARILAKSRAAQRTRGSDAVRTGSRNAAPPDTASAPPAAASAPVYSYIVEYNATRPWPTLACPGRLGHASPWAFHKIDLLAAIENWDFFRDYGSAERGFSPPGPRDVAFGQQLRRLWLEFAETGRLDSTPWRPALPVMQPGGGAPPPRQEMGSGGAVAATVSINVARLGGVDVVTLPGLKDNVCRFWATHGFDERFWLCN